MFLRALSVRHMRTWGFRLEPRALGIRFPSGFPAELPGVLVRANQHNIPPEPIRNTSQISLIGKCEGKVCFAV